MEVSFENFLGTSGSVQKSIEIISGNGVSLENAKKGTLNFKVFEPNFIEVNME